MNAKWSYLDGVPFAINPIFQLDFNDATNGAGVDIDADADITLGKHRTTTKTPTLGTNQRRRNAERQAEAALKYDMSKALYILNVNVSFVVVLRVLR